VPTANVVDILIGDRPIEKVISGIRPGEKVRESLIPEEEAHRVIERANYYVMLPILPEISKGEIGQATGGKEYSSGDNIIDRGELEKLLRQHRLMPEDNLTFSDELLR
jgi:FlaA1/EpsC-like NDP-sugar epimerase